MEFVTSGLWASLWASFLLTVVLFSCARGGGIFLRFLGLESPSVSFLERQIFSIGIGIIILSLGVLGLGSFGYLARPAVYLLLLFLSFLPLCFARGISKSSPLSLNNSFMKGDLLLWLSAGIVVFLSWVQATAPPWGNDALAYHLAHPKEFVLAQRISYLPGTRESLWPYLTEMLYTLGMLLQGTTLAGFFHWFFFVITAACIYAFGRRYFDGRSAIYAALIFLFTPAAFAQSGHAYVDLSFAFYILLAIYPFILVREIGLAKAALLSGIFCGGALSTKYLGLGAFGILTILWIVHAKKLKAGALFVLAAGLVSGAWYLRSWVILGNPVYPFFHQIFASGYPLNPGEQVGLGKNPLAFLLLGWNITMDPAPFGGEMMGPFYLMFLPGLLSCIRKVREESKTLFLFCLLYGAFIFTQSQQVRFFLSVVPLLSLGAGEGLKILTSRGRSLKAVSLLVFFMVLFAHTGIYIYRTRPKEIWPALLGRISAEQFLLKRERSYRGHLFLKNILKAGEKAFNAAEPRSFYEGGHNIVYEGRSGLFLHTLEKQGETVRDFLDRNQFEYIWLSANSDDEFKNYVVLRRYKKVYTYEFSEGGVLFQSLIYKKP